MPTAESEQKATRKSKIWYKACKSKWKYWLLHLGPSGREFEFPISDQKTSEINDFRGLFFIYCDAGFEPLTMRYQNSFLRFISFLYFNNKAIQRHAVWSLRTRKYGRVFGLSQWYGVFEVINHRHGSWVISPMWVVFYLLFLVLFSLAWGWDSDCVLCLFSSASSAFISAMSTFNFSSHSSRVWA